jgi:carbonic anhydrase
MPAQRYPAAGLLHVLLSCIALSCLTAPASAAGDSHTTEARPAPTRAALPVRPEHSDSADKPSSTGEDRPVAKSAHDVQAIAAAKPAGGRGARATAPDPLDKLRGLLADKLGATRAPQASPNVLRVAARSPDESHAAPAARRAVKGAAVPDAGHVAAAHRRSGEALNDAHGDARRAAHWSYQGAHGPESWGQMNAEFATCASGQRQSPIDIRDGIKVQLEPVQFDYRPSRFAVLDNGHTVQVNLAGGNFIDVMGRRYELQQFHFHRPSEERVNGRQFDMVAHLVHKSVDGRLAVIAVLLERGGAHPIVQSVWNNLPLEKNEELRATPLLDVNALLPTERGYFTYMGSLTTPPCSEGVLWMVMKEPVTVSVEQIGIFSRLYPMNARPIQAVSGRLIKESN